MIVKIIWNCLYLKGIRNDWFTGCLHIIACNIFPAVAGNRPLTDKERECLDEYSSLKDRIWRCRTSRDFAMTENMISKLERRYRKTSAVKWAGRDLHAYFNNMKSARIRSGHY